MVSIGPGRHDWGLTPGPQKAQSKTHPYIFSFSFQFWKEKRTQKCVCNYAKLIFCLRYTTHIVIIWSTRAEHANNTSVCSLAATSDSCSYAVKIPRNTKRWHPTPHPKKRIDMRRKVPKCDFISFRWSIQHNGSKPVRKIPNSIMEIGIMSISPSRTKHTTH